MRLKVKKGDTVMVLSGKDRGKKGQVERISAESNAIVVAGINLVKKHAKKTTANKQGGRVEFPAPINVSNVMLVCPSCGKTNRPQFKEEGGVRVRVCRKCGKTITGGKA